MKRIALFAIALWLAPLAQADVTVPAGTPKALNGQNYERSNAYKVGSIYFGDTSGNTLRLLAPDLADDTVVFQLPATNGSAGQPLVGNGSGALSYGDPTVTRLRFTETTTPATPPAGTVDAYAKSDGKLYKMDDTGTEVEVGSGSGGAGVENFIENGRAEDSTIVGISTYDDGASATPVDCTGGTASDISAAARNTSNPISETADYAFVKSAADAQGQGWAISVTLPANNPAAVAGWNAELSAIFRVVSGTYAAGDVGVYVYDVTNAVMSPKLHDVANSTQAYPWNGNFTTSGTSTSYRVCLHVQTSTSGVGFTLGADNFYAGIEKNGPVTVMPSVEETAYTPSNTQGFGTITNNQLRYERRGSSLRVFGRFTTGTVTGSEAQLALPESTVSASYANITVVGQWWRGTTSTDTRKRGPIQATAGDAFVNFGSDTYAQGSSPVGSLNGSSVAGSSETVSVDFTLTLSDWAGSANVSPGQIPEYACNSDTSDANDTTSFVNGMTTCEVPGALAAARLKRIQWRTPLVAGQIQECYLDMNGDGRWVKATAGGANDAGTATDGYSVTSDVGMGQLRNVSGSTTQFDVSFRRYRVSTSNWAGGSRWICAKFFPQTGNVFSLAAQDSPGLVSAGQVPGTNTNDDACEGCVGESLIQSRIRSAATALTNTTVANVTASSITLTPGDWDVSGMVGLIGTGATVSDVRVGVSKTSATMPGADVIAVPTSGEFRTADTFNTISTGTFDVQHVIPSYRVSVSTDTTIYLVARVAFSAGSVSAFGYYTARRTR